MVSKIIIRGKVDIAKLRYLLSYFFKVKIFGRLLSPHIKKNRDAMNSFRKKVMASKACVVVANGPSLCSEDLERLSAFPSIASNRINLIFEKTKWRPDLHTMVDPLLIYKMDLDEYFGIDVTAIPETHFLICKHKNKNSWRMISDNQGRKKYAFEKIPITPDNGFFVGRTITVVNLQLAIWAGAKKIYIIGCDHTYLGEDAEKSSGAIRHGGQQNHFHPQYRKNGELINSAPISEMNKGYELIEAIARERGVDIINISRRSELKSFRRADIDKLLQAEGI